MTSNNKDANEPFYNKPCASNSIPQYNTIESKKRNINTDTKSVSPQNNSVPLKPIIQHNNKFLHNTMPQYIDKNANYLYEERSR